MAMENPMMSGMSWPEANTGKIRRHVDMRSLIIDRNRQTRMSLGKTIKETKVKSSGTVFITKSPIILYGYRKMK